ncbi:hypothetical protein STEG23_004772, partial [Scotinomys teguina]
MKQKASVMERKVELEEDPFRRKADSDGVYAVVFHSYTAAEVSLVPTQPSPLLTGVHGTGRCY